MHNSRVVPELEPESDLEPDLEPKSEPDLEPKPELEQRYSKPERVKSKSKALRSGTSNFSGIINPSA